MKLRNISREIRELKELLEKWRHDRGLVYRKRNEYEVERHKFCVEMIEALKKDLKDAEDYQKAM